MTPGGGGGFTVEVFSVFLHEKNITMGRHTNKYFIGEFTTFMSKKMPQLYAAWVVILLEIIIFPDVPKYKVH